MPHKLLFVGMGNSCRSKMAEGFARNYGLQAESVGIMPAHELSHAAVLAMRERGIDIGHYRPTRLDFRKLGEFERILVMGDAIAQHSPDLHFHDNWKLEDPTNHPLPVVRGVRDEIERRVRRLADEIRQWSPPL